METLKKHSLKIQVGTIVGVIFFCFTFTWWVAGERAAIYNELDTAENQYEHCNKWANALDIRMTSVESSNIKQDLVLVEVRTQLAQIFTILEEIKTKLN